MKSFTRIKEIHGYTYAYEITPYYDMKSKRTKQKSKYLGRYKDGKIEPKWTKLPRRVFDYGEFLPFMKIMDELPIHEILRSLLPEKQVHTLLTLALNRMVHPVSLCNIRTWYEGTSLSTMYGSLPLASQSLSEFMEYIGESSLSVHFSERFIKIMGGGSPLLYDITSLSSSSNLIDILEYGYNRDGLALPQINLSLIAHKDLGVPLTFDIYPGSVVDVTTLKNTMKKLDAFGLKKPTLILDRGFFSETNINELLENTYDFIMPASFASNAVKSLVLTMRRDIESSENLVMYQSNPLFVKDIILDVGQRDVEGFFFYDLKREQEEKTRFYEHLHVIVERLKKRKLRAWENPQKIVEDIARDFAGYLKWSVRDGRFHVTVKNKAVAQRVNRMGCTVILCNGEHGWKEVLSWTRERDMIEKMFMKLKNDLEAAPMRAHKTEVIHGWIFVTYLALILQSRLMKILTETDLVAEYSVPSLLLELSKLKKVELSDGSMIITESTRKQRKIFDKLSIVP